MKLSTRLRILVTGRVPQSLLMEHTGAALAQGFEMGMLRAEVATLKKANAIQAANYKGLRDDYQKALALVAGVTCTLDDVILDHAPQGVQDAYRTFTRDGMRFGDAYQAAMALYELETS